MDSEGSTRDAQPRRLVFRSPAAVAFGVLWAAFAVINLADLALRGRDLSAAAIAALLLFATAVVYATCLRPRIVADDYGITVHNPLRDVRAPWSAVDRVDAADAVRLHVDGRRFRCWTPRTSHRERTRARLRDQMRDQMRDHPRGDPGGRMLGQTRGQMRGQRKTARYGAGPPETHPRIGRTRTDEVAAELDGLVQQYRDASVPAKSGNASVTWSPYPVAALATGVTALLAVAVVAWLPL